MAKHICSVCGYTHEGLVPPDKCPVCLASAHEFSEIQEEVVVEDVKKEARDESVDSEKNNNSKKDNVVNNEVDKKCDEDYSNKRDNKVNEVDDTNTEYIVKNSLLAPDEEEIINQYNSTHNNFKVVKWYKETYNISLKEAKDRVDEVLIKHNLWNGGGCVVTILVTITSTLSLFLLI